MFHVVNYANLNDVFAQNLHKLVVLKCYQRRLISNSLFLAHCLAKFVFQEIALLKTMVNNKARFVSSWETLPFGVFSRNGMPSSLSLVFDKDAD